MSVGECVLCVTTYDHVRVMSGRVQCHVCQYTNQLGMWVGMAVYVHVYIHGFVCNSFWVSCVVCGCVYT